MSIRRLCTFTRSLLCLSRGRMQRPAGPPHLPAWPLLSPMGWAAPTGWAPLAPWGCRSPSPSPLHKLSQNPSQGGGELNASPSSPLPFRANKAAQINRLKFQAARGYEGQEMLHLPDRLFLSRRHRAAYRRGEMPKFTLRTTTEQTEGNVYQPGSLNPTSGGHVIQRSSKHWTRSRGEKAQAPSFPWSNPAAPGKPHPSLLFCSS